MRRITVHITCLLFTLFFFAACGNKTEEEKGKKRNAPGKTIIETGELAAVNSKSFVMPRYGRYWYEMRIIDLLEHGAIVTAGDTIARLDATEIRKFIVDRETDLETQMATLEKLYVDQANSRHEMESAIKSEQASYNLKKIEVEASRFESPRARKIKELEFEQATITMEKEKKKRELSKVIQGNDLKIQQIRVKQIESDIQNAYDIIPQLIWTTPISGVFQLDINRRNGTMVKIGDQIYQGNNVANVPDLEYMQVNTYINENDFLRIKKGQKVAIRLDALPRLVFDGEISYIGKLCHLKDYSGKSREKVFDVEVRILKPDQRLKPGMTVSCEFLEED